MNKQLEKLFNLDPIESFEVDEPESFAVTTDTAQVVEKSSANMADRIDQALPQVRGVGDGDTEVDHIAEEAMKTYQEIKDLALNVEPRHSAELLAVAAQLLKTALDAKQGKTEAKLKAVRLQISALTAKKNQDATAGMTEIEGKVVGGRNQIIAAMRKSKDPAK